MKKIIFFIVTLAAICVSCKKDPEPFVISAEMEQLGQEYDGKVFLENEHFLVFENDDVLLWKDGDNYALAHSGSGREVRLYGSEATDDGGKTTNKGETIYHFESGELYGVLPASAMMNKAELALENVEKDYLPTPKLNYPSSWTYRQDSRNDFSFGKEAFPMVAYRASGSGPLGFHSVSGIARVQLFADAAATVSQVTFTCENQKNISGEFTINGIGTEAPYITGGNNNAITIESINQPVGPSNLLTLYLPLPAQVQQDDGNMEVRGITQYKLKMTVTNSTGGTFTKEFGVDIRRNCITMMPAIKITEWKGDESAASIHLVGCGTKERPFQIYTFDELVMVREAYKTNPRGTINGQAITPNTYIKVVRADIFLENQNRDDYGLPHATGGIWSEGIQNFIGHFTCSSNHPTLHGIVNNSYHPLFESIAEGGVVDSVTIRGTVSPGSSTDIGDFSPICLFNYGVMNNCVNTCSFNGRNNVAGVCYTNYGTLNGCRNEGNLATIGAGRKLAGICMENYNEVRNCVGVAKGVMSSPGTSAAHGTIGGIVHTNKGIVKTSYYNLNTEGAQGDIGGIVYSNEVGKTVQSCYVTGSFSVTSTYSVGGICHDNKGNIVDCRNQMTMLKGSKYVGGITATMSGGIILNCYLDGGGTITTNTDQVECGGFVGYLTGGSILNSFNTDNCHLGHSNQGSTVGGAVGKINAQSKVQIGNCYTSFNVNFYGSKSGEAQIGIGGAIGQCYSRNTQGETGITLIGYVQNDPKLYLIGSGGTIVKDADNTPIKLSNKLQEESDRHQSADSKYRSWKDGNHPVFL